MANRFESLSCSECGTAYPLEAHYRCQSCGGILDAKYNVGEGFPGGLPQRSMWDFADFLPPIKEKNIVSLGEGWTPYPETPALARLLGISSLRCKVEGSNPTGAFKDRAASLGVSLALDWGKAGVFTASDGNAAASVSAYSARAKLRCLVVVNDGVPASKLGQIMTYGPEMVKVVGLYDSFAKLESTLALLEKSLPGWRNLFVWAPYNPLVVDGLKTMAFEIALSGDIPDLVFVPTAGGDLLYGLYKGFMELRACGKMDKVPKIVAVQGKGADPVVRALEQGLDKVQEGGPPATVASALRVNFGAEHSLKAVRKTNGFGISVSDRMILDAQRQVAAEEGIFCELSSATSVAAIREALESGLIDRDQKATAILTGFGLKEYVPPVGGASHFRSAASDSELAGILKELADTKSMSGVTATRPAPA